MAAKKKASVIEDGLEEQEESQPLPLIMPISELLKLSDKEKQAFRDAGGTSIEG